jgi:YVTN family beta-propeller protein
MTRVALFAAVLLTTAIAAACRAEQPAQPEKVEPAPAPPPALKGAYGVYVTNEMSGDLTVIDPETDSAIATIPLGKRPRGIRFSPDARHLFVALSGSPIAPPGVDEKTLPPPDRGADGIGMVDAKALKLVKILRGPSDPEQTSVSRDGTRLYVANEDAGKATVLEIATGKTVAEFEVGGEPEGVTTSPDGRFVYVTSEEDSQVAVIDTKDNRLVRRVKVGARPRDSAFLPDSTRAYVTGENDGTVSVIDTSSHRVIRTITLTGENVRPMGVVVSPDGERIYVSTGRGGTVAVIDAKTNMPVGSVAVGQRPWGIALSSDGARLYTANGPSNDVSIVDTASLTVVKKIPAGDRPWGVAAVPVR